MISLKFKTFLNSNYATVANLFAQALLRINKIAFES